MERNTMLAVVLSIAVIMVYSLVFQQPAQKANNLTANATAVVITTTGDAKTPSGVVHPVTSATAVPAKQTARKIAPAKEIQVDTPLYSAIFSTRGASLKSFQLKKYNVKMDKGALKVEMVNIKADSHLPLALIFVESSVNMPQDVVFSTNTDKLAIDKADKQGRQLAFTTTHGKIKVEKIFTFHPDGYNIGVDVKVTNLADITLSQNPVLLWYSGEDHSGKTEQDERVGPLYYLVKDVKRTDDKDLASGKLDGPNISWAGYESKYFLVTMVPPTPALATVSLGKDLTNTAYVGLFGGKMLVPPHETTSATFSLFVGPKEYDALSQQGLKLENAIDFGFFKWISVPMLALMKFFYKYIPNYGVGIIILALLIKIIFWPLGNISYRSMNKMQALQPRMKELQEKYKDDKQKLGQETMALYKAHKVNPMSGCLPMVVQIPVFFALFNALQFAIELRHAHFFLWITDLSAADPYYVTPVLMGATMFIQQKMSPPPADPMQAKVMMFLPLIFTFFFLNFSSGLVLYWLLSNVLSIGQQFYVNKKLS